VGEGIELDWPANRFTLQIHGPKIFGLAGLHRDSEKIALAVESAADDMRARATLPWVGYAKLCRGAIGGSAAVRAGSVLNERAGIGTGFIYFKYSGESRR
jgi:hypothetical protein